MNTKTIHLDFGDDNIEATVTFEDEPPRGPMACPMCSEAADSELTRMTMCSRCQDSASDCAACTQPAVTEADYQAVVNDDDPHGRPVSPAGGGTAWKTTPQRGCGTSDE